MKRFKDLDAVRAALGLAMRRSNRRRPPRSSAPALVEPPRGPLPLAGGAEVPLEFD